MDIALSCLDGSLECVEGGNQGKLTRFNGAVDWGDSGAFASVSSDFVLYQGNSREGLVSQTFSGYGFLDSIVNDVVSSPIQTSGEEMKDVESKKQQQHPSCLASLELLNNYGGGFKLLQKKTEVCNDGRKVAGREVSTEEVMRIAGARFIQCSSHYAAESLVNHPFKFSVSNLSDEETKDVELAVCLLAAAEKVGYQQYNHASNFLNLCDSLCCSSGSPVQRVVYYFCLALRRKIDRETGRITSDGSGKKLSYDLYKKTMSPNLTSLVCETRTPFCHVGQFSGIQAIVETVADSKKVHVIDLGIRNGSQWTVLMQALVARYECPIELLKITAIGTTSKPLIEDTGKRLMKFAETMNLPFSFKIVMVSDMVDLREEIFELDATEAVVVYAAHVLRTMVSQPNQLECLMRVMRSIKPRVMVVNEVEASLNSPHFVNRFTEALFFFSAHFDCLEACMKNDPNRLSLESSYFSEGIKNIVAAEGEERSIRNVTIDVWRAFFTRFGMDEKELSMSSLYQADLVLKKFDCGHSCTLDMNRKCLIIGWKGSPLQSLSVWEFL